MDTNGSTAERTRRWLTGTAAAVLLAGALTLSTGVSHAAETCAGLDATLRRQLDAIVAERAHPDALTAARVATQQHSVTLLQQQRVAAGCAGDPVPAATASPR